jgi:hypothetical protein
VDGVRACLAKQRVGKEKVMKACVIWALALGPYLAGCAASVEGGAMTRRGGPDAADEPVLTYHAERVRGLGGVTALRARLGARVYSEVLRLNRVDADHAPRLDTLIVPDRAHGFRVRSPFPERIAALDAVPKILLVSVRVQAFAAYDSGRLARSGPISSGGPTAPTASGLYHVNWKLPEHRSTIDSTWVMPWCVNIDNEVGTAIHQYALPGRPASHCCIRLLEDDALWVYEWVETWRVSADGREVLSPGTPVNVFGTYDFDAPPPWRRLPVDPAADRVGADEIEDLMAEGAR